MKALGAYFYYAKLKFMTSFIYRFEFFASVLSSILILFSTVFLWRTVYHAVSSVEGSSENQMITYAILSALLGNIFNLNVEKEMYERMMMGDIAMDFVRPTNMLICYLAEDIGLAIGSVLNRFLPMVVFVSIFFFQPVPANLPAFFMFLISTLLSFGILWLIQAIVGVSHMKLMDVGNFAMLVNALVAILSGSIIPIWFLPEQIRVIIGFLPFQHIYQTPLGIYIGKYPPSEAVIYLLIQAIWICILLLILYGIWESARKNLMVQGG